MRDENLPIKLTCFSIGSNNTRESIGFILVQMRTVKYTFGRKNVQMKPRWHKLLGVHSHWKQQKPELLLSVSLIDRGGDCRNTVSQLTIIGGSHEINIVTVLTQCYYFPLPPDFYLFNRATRVNNRKTYQK